MERKTMIHAEEGKHDLVITREFELPVDLLFKAHTDPDLFVEWMSHEYGIIRIVTYDCRPHGAWRFRTVDQEDNILFQANGVFHEVVTDQKITRTFEMENTPFPVQLDFIEFESLGEDKSRLTIHSIYKTVDYRDQMLKLPFAAGLNMAHDRLQKIVSKLK